MNFQNPLLQQLSHYGINPNSLNQKQLQEKIIQLYDLLEQTTTQNLLLKKQNDDINLQIKTIEEVFTQATNNLKQGLSPRTYQKVSSQTFFDHPQQKNNNPQNQTHHPKINPTIHDHSQSQDTCKAMHLNHNHLEENGNSQHESVQTQQKTPRYSSKPHRNSRFCSDQKNLDKQQTSRIISANKLQSEKDRALNEKIQILMKQNEIILKRMNQIEMNFIKSQKDEENFQYHKHSDDRSTHLSSHATSIKNIWSKKDTQIPSKGLSLNRRTHYSTSNLKSYCQGVE